MIELKPISLTKDNFAKYGEVIEFEQADNFQINFGLTTRFHDLVKTDFIGENAHTLVNIFRSNPIPLPHKVKIMEKHPLGSQFFFSLNTSPFLVMVADSKNEVLAQDLKLFITNGKQAINFYRNTWHHYQMVLEISDFLVVDRGGEGNNLIEVEVKGEAIIQI